MIYKFSCAECASEYVGSTIRPLYVSVAEHAGVSPRTGAPLASPPHSSIRDHMQSCKQPVNLDNFSIIGSSSGTVNLRILESLYIFKLKPHLNSTQSAYPLNIVNR